MTDPHRLSHDGHELFTPGPMREFLVSKGWIDEHDTIELEMLPGGVSNYTALLTVSGKGSMVIKKARDRLAVQSEWRSDPRRAMIEAKALHWLSEFLPPGSSCPLYWVSQDEQMFAGAAVPHPHTIWKSDLLAGVIERRRFVQFAELLGRLHVGSSISPVALGAFEDRTFFETLRLDPYYRSTAVHLPQVADFVSSLVDRTLATRRCLVHGDASPKNVLLHLDSMVLIDHEVVHAGDPCFDVGFALSHFLCKLNHLRSHRNEIAAAIAAFLSTYVRLATSGPHPVWGSVEGRRCRRAHTRVRARTGCRQVARRVPERRRALTSSPGGAQPAGRRHRPRCADDPAAVPRCGRASGGRFVSFEVVDLRGVEVLDSRGQPTVYALCRLESGAVGQASVPAGRSTGSAEAPELRDHDPGRFGGLGCRRAAAAVGELLLPAVVDRTFADQPSFDARLTATGEAAGIGRIGANSILATSIAFARAAAAQLGVSLLDYLAAERTERRLPRPMINLFSGGLHGGSAVELQDLLVVPLVASSTKEVLEVASAVYAVAEAGSADRYGTRAHRADEGGLAPPFRSNRDVFDYAVECISSAGFQPGRDVGIAIDVAASHFANGTGYCSTANSWDLENSSRRSSSGWATTRSSASRTVSRRMIRRGPSCARRCQTVAGSLATICCARRRSCIVRARESGAADALLLKVNQAGSLTKAADALRAAREGGWMVVASARSGETEDDWLADLAVAWRADSIKIGSLRQSERLAKYNRLVVLEELHGWPMAAWPTRAGSAMNVLFLGASEDAFAAMALETLRVALDVEPFDWSAPAAAAVRGNRRRDRHERGELDSGVARRRRERAALADLR